VLGEAPTYQDAERWIAARGYRGTDVRKYDDAVKATQLSLEAVAAGFEIGTRNSVDVMDAIADFIQARLRRRETLVRYTSDVLDQMRPSNESTAAALLSISSSSVHYREVAFSCGSR
jgi:outer membrane protein TolC